MGLRLSCFRGDPSQQIPLCIRLKELQVQSGLRPYAEYTSDLRVILALNGGQLPLQPPTIDGECWNLIQWCCAINSDARPTAEAVRSRINRLRLGPNGSVQGTLRSADSQPAYSHHKPHPSNQLHPSTRAGVLFLQESDSENSTSEDEDEGSAAQESDERIGLEVRPPSTLMTLLSGDVSNGLESITDCIIYG